MATKKSKTTKSAFIWFANDADGLSLIDLLAAGMFAFFLLTKVVHLVLSIRYIQNPELITQMNVIMNDVNTNMYYVITFYFVKKSVDTTITKVGLFKAGQYTNLNDAEAESSNEHIINEDTSNLDETTHV
jgi:hypothetical protein